MDGARCRVAPASLAAGAEKALFQRAATGFRGLERNPGRRARRLPRSHGRCAGARKAVVSSRCCAMRAARPSTMPSRNCARPSISAAITLPRYAGISAIPACCCPAPRRGEPLKLRGRGAFVCISPWNFPLAIFLGQVSAALVAGNSVIAKPAEQTPRIADAAVRLFHEAGVPPDVLQIAVGDGRIGAALVAHPRRRWRRLHRLDRGCAADQPRARGQGWPDRTADRGDRRHQRHDRRRHRVARAGDGRCRDFGFPLRRPTLLGVAAALRRGACGGQGDRR